MSTARETPSLPISLPEYRTVVAAMWVAAVVCYVAGDTGTTIVSLSLGGIEAAPVAGWFLEIGGYAGLVANKALVVSVCVVVWRLYPSIGAVGPDPFRLVIPAAMIVRGLWLTTHNLTVIAALV